MPFAGYKNMAECKQAHSDKKDPAAYCAEIMRQAEKGMAMQCPECDRAGFLTQEALEDHAAMVHTFDETRGLIRRALKEREDDKTYVYIRDLTDDWVVYESSEDYNLYKCSYTLDDNGAVTLGTPVEVYAKVGYVPVPQDEDSSELRNWRDKLIEQAWSFDRSEADLGKAKHTAEDRKKYGMKGGKFPIADCQDVTAAVSRLGQQKGVSNAAVKAHIKKRAKALGCTDKLPDDW